MNAVSQKLIAKMLRDAAHKIESGTCGLSDEEMQEVASMFMHRRINIEQTCQYFGISRATLNRWQQCGKLPPFRKDCGGKDYMYADEAEKYLEEWNKSHSED